MCLLHYLVDGDVLDRGVEPEEEDHPPQATDRQTRDRDPVSHPARQLLLGVCGWLAGVWFPSLPDLKYLSGGRKSASASCTPSVEVAELMSWFTMGVHP